ncbi:MAG: radical SAM protein [Vicinamibacterales bacterium]
MRPMADAWSILIEITNACRLKCAHCTAGVPHVKQPYFMTLEHLERALQSLEGWKKGVGCFGGEPTLHPKFPEVCALFRQYFPRHQLAMWTCGGPQYEKYRALIDETFANVAYNDHESAGFHQPLMIANEDVVPDPEARRRLIENCWVPRHWSPLVTHRGAYFCEVAATFDNLFQGPGGHALEKGWWKKDFSAFAYQREHSCRFCSIPLPIEPVPDSPASDHVSRGNAARLLAAGSPLARQGRLTVVDHVDLDARVSRNPRWFAPTGTPHFWTRTTFRAGLWLAAQYRHVPRAPGPFLRDVSRYAALKVSYLARWATTLVSTPGETAPTYRARTGSAQAADVSQESTARPATAVPTPNAFVDARWSADSD